LDHPGFLTASRNATSKVDVLIALFPDTGNVRLYGQIPRKLLIQLYLIPSVQLHSRRRGGEGVLLSLFKGAEDRMNTGDSRFPEPASKGGLFRKFRAAVPDSDRSLPRCLNREHMGDCHSIVIPGRAIICKKLRWTSKHEIPTVFPACAAQREKCALESSGAKKLGAGPKWPTLIVEASSPYRRERVGRIEAKHRLTPELP
jgi:hypothetical protein